MAQQTKVLIAKPDRQNSVPLPMVKEKWTPCGKEKDSLSSFGLSLGLLMQAVPHNVCTHAQNT